MTSYSSLLSAILSAVNGDDDSNPLAYLPSPSEPNEREEPQSRGEFRFPSEVISQDFSKHYYRDLEDFLIQGFHRSKEQGSSVVFAFPPIIGRQSLPPEWRREHSPLSPTEAFAESIFEESETNLLVEPQDIETLILLLPESALRFSQTGDWRRQFFPRHSATIIEHGPLRLFPDATSLPFSTLILHKNSGAIKFFKIPSDNTQEEHIARDLKQLITQPAGKTRYGYVFNGTLEPNYPCSFDFYSEETERLRAQSSVLGEKVSLGEIADVYNGFRPSNRNRGPGPRASSGFDFICGRDITPDGRVNLDELRHQERSSENVTFLEDGDICIRDVFTENSERGFVVAEFKGDGRQVTFGNGVIVVRPKPFLTLPQRHVLLCYLRSPVAGRLSVAKGSRLGGLLRIFPSMLRDYPVPLAGKELTSALEAIAEARNAFRSWQDDCSQAEQAIMMMTDAEDVKREILSAGQLARQRHTAGTQVEELDFRIRTQFPHPIAYLWRESQVDSPNHYGQFRDILKTAEAATCFLAQLGILMARTTGKDIKYLPTIAERLRGKSGTNFGDWFAILQELNESRKFRDLPSSAPFSGLTTMFQAEGIKDSLQSLMRERNDDSHGRVNHSTVNATDVERSANLLENLFAGMDFLTDYKLVQITETRYDALLKTTNYQYRNLSGDHPLPSVHKGTSERQDLEAESLYMIDQNEELHLFRPLLHYLECPGSHHLSTFYLDTYEGKGDEVTLKSFERSSTRQESFAMHFQAVGLLAKSR